MHKNGPSALLLLFLFSFNGFTSAANAQSMARGGTVGGIVTDPSGAAVPGASVEMQNAVSGYRRTVTTDATGAFRLTNVPPNPYHLSVTAAGFTPTQQDLAVRSAVPVNLKVELTLAAGQTSITVSGETADLIENIPTGHSDVDRNLIEKLPISQAGSGLSEAITLATPGVVADSNGFFHPLGDHAQASFLIDNQPITDQQSKQFSTQIPLNAIESLEAIHGFPAAEFGDKTSLVINANTRSGLGHDHPFGSFMAQYGSFGTYGEESSFGFGKGPVGNFVVANAARSGRFLDSPEFRPFHDRGNNQTIFDRLDWQPNTNNAVHLNLFAARNWFQVANTIDQQLSGQDQRQQARTYNIALGWVHTFNPKAVLTFNPFFRQDRVQYFPSADPESDLPATLRQDRRLGNLGFRTDLSYVHGVHNVKIGGQLTHTFLTENFSLGLTDPGFNPVCLTRAGEPVVDSGLVDPDSCAGAGFAENPALQPGLVPFDLTRRGRPFEFRGHTDIKQISGYVQDSVTAGGFSVNLGLRVDDYNGLTQLTSVQPRFGISYLIAPTSTVLRASYARTTETPYNENLIVSSVTGIGGLATNVFGAVSETPLRPGQRNQYNIGFEQGIAKRVAVDFDYFWKFTRNAYDFDTLFNTPVYFPISWHKSKIDGLSARINLITLRGFSAFTVLGHTRSRFFGPENGGIIFNSPVDQPVFRIDHDQAFQQTTHLRYQHGKQGPWLAFTWRYDSGLVSGSVAELGDLLNLTPAQQAAVGFFCGASVATISNPITQCGSSNYGAKLLRLPAPGTANEDTNPPRIAPRHLFDIGAGIDNLFRTEHYHVVVRFTGVNLTNKVALYNFLSTFSGTHFLTPRSYRAEVGIVF